MKVNLKKKKQYNWFQTQSLSSSDNSRSACRSIAAGAILSTLDFTGVGWSWSLVSESELFPKSDLFVIGPLAFFGGGFSGSLSESESLDEEESEESLDESPEEEPLEEESLMIFGSLFIPRICIISTDGIKLLLGDLLRIELSLR